MRKLTLLLTAGAVGALVVSVATRTEAGALSGAEGIRIASNDVSAIQNVLYGRRVYRRAAYGGALYRAPVRRAVAYGAAATAATAAYGYAPGYGSYGYAPGGNSYGYAPGYGSYGYGPSIHEQLGDGSIQRAGGGYSDAAFGFGPTGSISDGR